MCSEVDSIVVNVLGKNLAVNVVQDNDAESPRDWHNLGTMMCSHRRYTLGDTQLESASHSESHADDLADYAYQNLIHESYDEKYFDGYNGDLNRDGLDRAKKWVEKNLICLPLFLMDHSGLSISTAPFSCSWDSGTIGFIFCTKDKARTEFGVKRLSQETINRVLQDLKNEVSLYNDWLNGSVYRYYSVDLDISCGGFFGYDHESNGLADSAKHDCLWSLRQKFSSHFEKLKAQISNRVPLHKRSVLMIG